MTACNFNNSQKPRYANEKAAEERNASNLDLQLQPVTVMSFLSMSFKIGNIVSFNGGFDI